MFWFLLMGKVVVNGVMCGQLKRMFAWKSSFIPPPFCVCSFIHYSLPTCLTPFYTSNLLKIGLALASLSLHIFSGYLSILFRNRPKISLLILTHYSPVLLFYTPWKHQKTFRFSGVFRGYRKATPVCYGLSEFKRTK